MIVTTCCNTLLNYLLFAFVCALSFGGVFAYKKLVSDYVLADPNYRSLHEYPTPTGAGIVFSSVFTLLLFIFYKVGFISVESSLIVVLCLGGVIATLFGLLDDIVDLKASVKLVVHHLLAGLCAYYLSDYIFYFIGYELFAVLVLVFVMVWMINAYNFIDGIDGFAASGAVIISLTLYFSLLLSDANSLIAPVFLLLSASVIGFVFFNWPPASIFMGDAGSVFLGYIFGVLLFFTVLGSYLSIWTWLTVFGYFLGDTVVTQIMRVFLVKRWWHPHRSHAYQNLARITGSHYVVTSRVVIYHLLWISPLTFLTVILPDYAFIVMIIALTPGIIVAYMYGPRYSSS